MKEIDDKGAQPGNEVRAWELFCDKPGVCLFCFQETALVEG